MTMQATAQASRFDRILDATPVFGPLSRAISKDINLIFYVLVILLTALVLAIKTWGIVALVMTYLALIPFVFLFFIVITLP
jgi:hypothetical protein